MDDQTNAVATAMAVTRRLLGEEPVSAALRSVPGVFADLVALGMADGRRLVAKVPTGGPAGPAGRRSGAYRREALFYRELAAHCPVRTPAVYGIETDDDDGAVVLLEDLTDARWPDQEIGLEPDTALALLEDLARLHGDRHTADRARAHGVRGPAVSAHDPSLLAAGRRAVDEVWGERISASARSGFERLWRELDDRRRALSAAPAVLTHGDPRAGNVALDPPSPPVWIDWQQISLQPATTDVAWLLATSLTPASRRQAVERLADAGIDRAGWDLGLTHPGSAVLLLAGRPPVDEAQADFVARSLERIGTALDEAAAATGRR